MYKNETLYRFFSRLLTKPGKMSADNEKIAAEEAQENLFAGTAKFRLLNVLFIWWHFNRNSSIIMDFIPLQ
jgi:hypothetical protein